MEESPSCFDYVLHLIRCQALFGRDLYDSPFNEDVFENKYLEYVSAGRQIAIMKHQVQKLF